MVILTSSWGLDSIFAVVSTFLLLFLFFQQRYKYWRKLNVPHTQPKFPWGDLGKSMMTDGLPFSIKKIYESFKDEKIIGIWFFCSPILIVKDLDLIKDILIKNFMSFHDRGLYVNEKDDPLAGHLFSIDGTKWRNIRTKLTPTFTSGKMKMMFPILVECSNAFAEVLDKFAERQDTIEIKDYLARFTTDVISSCAFGLETNSLKNPDAIFRQMGKRVIEPSLMNALRFLVNLNPTFAKLIRARFFDPTATDFFLRAVKETIDYRKSNDVIRKDFMQLLIQLMDKGKIEDADEIKGVNDSSLLSGQKFSFKEAAAQAFGFFVAGFETSSMAMQFALYELALNPDMQEKLRAEIKTVLEKNNERITYEAIHDMDFLGRVIDESLRKYPPVTFLIRQSTKDYKFDDADVVIPKGTYIHIPVYAIHHGQKYYPNPDRFDPDRFKEELKTKRHHFAYLPFGDGPRNCIGMRFALMQSRVGLVKLLTHFKFEISEKTHVPIVFDPAASVLNPKGGMHLRILKL